MIKTSEIDGEGALRAEGRRWGGGEEWGPTPEGGTEGADFCTR